MTVASDGQRLGVVYGDAHEVVLVQAGVAQILPALPKPAATTRFVGTEMHAFGVYDDVKVYVDDKEEGPAAYAAEINGVTWYGMSTGDASGATPCGEWRLEDGAWAHVADGLAGTDAHQGDRCPEIAPAAPALGGGTVIDLDFPYRGGVATGRGPLYPGTLHAGGPFVVTSEWEPGQPPPLLRRPARVRDPIRRLRSGPPWSDSRGRGQADLERQTVPASVAGGAAASSRSPACRGDGAAAGRDGGKSGPRGGARGRRGAGVGGAVAPGGSLGRTASFWRGRSGRPTPSSGSAASPRLGFADAPRTARPSADGARSCSRQACQEYACGCLTNHSPVRITAEIGRAHV